MLISCGIGVRLLEAVSGGGALELGKDASKPRLKAPLLGRSQFLGDDEVGEAQQGLLDVVQTLLERGGGRRACGARRRLVAQRTEGSTQDLAAVGFVGHTIGTDQGKGLAQGKAGSLDGGQQGILVLGRQSTEGVSQGRTDGPLGKLVFAQRRQVSAEVDSASHPVGFAPEPAGDGSPGKSLLTGQRADHPGLIGGGEGARR